MQGSGVLEAVTRPGSAPPGASFLAQLFTQKESESIGTMFLRGILCNLLVTLGVWMAARTRSDGAKLVLLLWVLLAFITTGSDHVVADMTIYTPGMLAGLPQATVGTFATNMLFVGLGNPVGGGLVGAAHGYLRRAHTSDDVPTPTAGSAAEEPATEWA